MKQVQNCFEWNLNLCTFKNVASVLAVVYVLLGRAVTEYRWGGSHNILFMRHKCFVLTVKKLLKSVYINGSYRKIKTGLSLFWTTLLLVAGSDNEIRIRLSKKPENRQWWCWCRFFRQGVPGTGTRNCEDPAADCWEPDGRYQNAWQFPTCWPPFRCGQNSGSIFRRLWTEVRLVMSEFSMQTL